MRTDALPIQGLADAAWLTNVGDMLVPGDIVGGKYELLRLVGAGGMGAVIEARHVNLEERVAVKILRPDLLANEDAVDRFVREARTAFRIRSEHVAQIYDVGTTDNGVPYMAMELLDGHDLGVELQQRTRLPFDMAIDTFLQICSAVAEGHALGIVHRDLKPENVFLCSRRDGSVTVKILDFGLSKAQGTDSGRERSLTATSAAMGTPHYMSPEQWACAKTSGTSTDIWALGAMLYEMLGGSVPFGGDSIPEIYVNIISTAPRPLSELGVAVPHAVSDAITRCLVKDSQRRLSSVAELMQALAPYAARTVRVSSTQSAGSFAHAESAPQDLSQTVALAPSVARTRSQTEVLVPPSPGAVGHTLQAWQAAGDAAPPPRRRWPIVVAALLVAAGAATSAYVALLPGDAALPSASPAAPLPEDAPTLPIPSSLATVPTPPSAAVAASASAAPHAASSSAPVASARTSIPAAPRPQRVQPVSKPAPVEEDAFDRR